MIRCVDFELVQLVELLIDNAQQQQVLPNLLALPDDNRLTPLHWATVNDHSGRALCHYVCVSMVL
jgi:ankyrin repeat protein